MAERKRGAEWLHDSEELLRRLFENSPDAIVVVDSNGQVKQVNQQTEALFGYQREELLEQPVEMLLPESLRDRHQQHREHYLANAELRNMGTGLDLFGQRKDGTEFPVDIMLSPMPTKEGNRVIATVRDVTERKRIEENIHNLNAELERQVAQLEAANKELEGFAYSVSHDLRAPLRAIDGFARILEEDFAERLDAEGQRVLRVIRDNSQKMGILIDDLLAFSRLGRTHLATARLDMGVLVREVFNELRVDAGERPVVFRLLSLPPAWGDRSLLRQVWINLLANAIKFSSGRERPVIEVDSRAEAGKRVYSVKDNGVGFDMRYYDKLFGVFQRLHRAEEFPGTGVGLAMVQRIIHRHGGRVWAEGTVGQGATFYFTLPKEA